MIRQQFSQTQGQVFAKTSGRCPVLRLVDDKVDLREIAKRAPDIDFRNARILDDGTWTGAGYSTSSVCGTADQSGTRRTAFVFNTAGERRLESANVFASYGGHITFSLRFGGPTTSPSCPGPAAASVRVLLQWTNNDGRAWATLEPIEPDRFGSWRAFKFELPEMARAGATRVRVFQADDGANRGVFAIDDVTVNVVPKALPGLVSHRFFPHSGPDSGDTLVTIWGAGFDPAGQLACGFGDYRARALVFINSTLVLCLAPRNMSTPADFRFAEVPFGVCGSTVRDPTPFTLYSRSRQMATQQRIYSISSSRNASWLLMNGTSFFVTREAKVRFNASANGHSWPAVTLPANVFASADPYATFPPADAKIVPRWPLANTDLATRTKFVISAEQLISLGLEGQTIGALDFLIAVAPTAPIERFVLAYNIGQFYPEVGTELAFNRSRIAPSEFVAGKFFSVVLDKPIQLQRPQVFPLILEVSVQQSRLGGGGAFAFRHTLITQGYQWAAAPTAGDTWPFDLTPQQGLYLVR